MSLLEDTTHGGESNLSIEDQIRPHVSRALRRVDNTRQYRAHYCRVGGRCVARDPIKTPRVDPSRRPTNLRRYVTAREIPHVSIILDLVLSDEDVSTLDYKQQLLQMNLQLNLCPTEPSSSLD